MADFEVLRYVAMAIIFGFLYMGCTLAQPEEYLTEPSMCGGDAALCQITLTTCLLLVQSELDNVEQHLFVERR